MRFDISTTDLDGIALSFHHAGEGRPVLYLHSAGGVTVTRPLEDLARIRRVIAPIVPGFDGTKPAAGIGDIAAYVDLLAKYVDREIGQRVDVIGSSFGSWVALWLAVKRPDLVDHLVLGVPAGFRFDGKGGLPQDPAARFKALYAHPERIAGSPKPDEILAANRRIYEAMTAGPPVDEALSARLSGIEAVTLILLGTEDPVVPAEAGAHLKRHIPNSQRVFVYDAAHSIEIDQPDRVSRLWQGFLEWGPSFVLNRGAHAA